MKLAALPVLALALTVIGCSTVANFKIPENTKLYLEERPAEVRADGTVRMRPFFWTSVTGVHYRLEKDGQTVERGRVASTFRPVSIFWPPYGLIYWPMGFADNATYDLVNRSPNVRVYEDR